MEIGNMKIGFIGAGNMATAIIKGLISSKIISPNSIYVTDKDTSKLDEFKNMGANIESDNITVATKVNILLLAVKPNIYPIVLKELSTYDNISKKIIISIAAGITIDYIKGFFNKDVKVIRTMPNTPALVGEGMTVICKKDPVTDEEFEVGTKIFTSIGKVEQISENYMNEVVAVNGSSPAYVYMMIEAMADAAVLRGIPRDMAYRLVSQSILGSAKMVLETGLHPGQLKDMVCSPSGTTIKAVYELEKTGFRASLISAMEECTKRAIELSK